MSQTKSKLKELVKESFSFSTIHGLANIATNTHLPIKALWTILLLASSGICSYLVVLSVISYLEYDVSIKISKISETTSLFPTITICNSSPFITKNSTSLQENFIIEKQFSQFLNSFEKFYFMLQFFLLSSFTNTSFSSYEIILIRVLLL